MERRICRLCGERPVPPSRVKDGDYRCSRCRHNTPAARAANQRYFKTDKKRACSRRSNKKRIMIGRTYHSMMPTAEAARVINEHIKERRLGFIARQSNRKEAESPTTR